VAGKYSSNNVLDMLGNIRRGISASEHIFRLGYAPFCPWLDYHFELLNDHGLEDFYEYSMAWLEASDAVMMLPGWEDSHGATAERNRAIELKIPVYTYDEFVMKHTTGEIKKC